MIAVDALLATTHDRDRGAQDPLLRSRPSSRGRLWLMPALAGEA
jgi:hypothetical protein